MLRVSAPIQVAVLIPVKAFGEAKNRLAPSLDAIERAKLARAMAAHVVSCAKPLPVAIVCDDPEVREWGLEAGAEVIWCPGTGLNGAVRSGVDHLRDAGIAQAIVSHGDLPLAGPLAPLGDWPGITLVPDHRNDGTNVIALPCSNNFQFSYGHGSFRRHLAEAQQARCSLRVLRDLSFGLDIDIPADLAKLANTENHIDEH